MWIREEAGPYRDQARGCVVLVEQKDKCVQCCVCMLDRLGQVLDSGQGWKGNS